MLLDERLALQPQFSRVRVIRSLPNVGLHGFACFLDHATRKTDFTWRGFSDRNRAIAATRTRRQRTGCRWLLDRSLNSPDNFARNPQLRVTDSFSIVGVDWTRTSEFHPADVGTIAEHPHPIIVARVLFNLTGRHTDSQHQVLSDDRNI